MKQLFASDRALPQRPSLQVHFATVIERDLTLYKLHQPPQGVAALANWLYADSVRCPSVRLKYEVYHKILKNTMDVPCASDLEDLWHLSCLPYIDLMSADRRMHGYVSQAATGLSLNYGTRLVRTAQEVLCRL